MTYYDSEDTSSNIMTYHDSTLAPSGICAHMAACPSQVFCVCSTCWRSSCNPRSQDSCVAKIGNTLWLLVSMTVSTHTEPCRFGSSSQTGTIIKVAWTCLKPETKSGLGNLHSWRLTRPQPTKLATLCTDLQQRMLPSWDWLFCWTKVRVFVSNGVLPSRAPLCFTVGVETAAFSCRALKALKSLCMAMHGKYLRCSRCEEDQGTLWSLKSSVSGCLPATSKGRRKGTNPLAMLTVDVAKPITSSFETLPCKLKMDIRTHLLTPFENNLAVYTSRNDKPVSSM